MDINLEPISEAVRKASFATQLVQEQNLRADKWSKEDETPVTVADLASQVILLGAIAESFPDDEVFAEEGTISLEDSERTARVREILEEVLGHPISSGEIKDHISYRGITDAQGRWFVDPLDGTKGFVKNLIYAVAIARTVKGQLDKSWLAVPCREELFPGIAGMLFRAEKGKGSYKSSISGKTDEQKLVMDVSGSGSDGEVTVVVSRAHDNSKGPGRLTKGGMKTNHLALDSQAKYAALVTGSAQLYPRRHSTSFGANFCWDHAPGALLLEETGGIITDLTGRPLDYAKGERLSANHGILAATDKKIHEKALNILRVDQ
ncbi:inositol monophosphatase family protein [Calditrichota bacterium]